MGLDLTPILFSTNVGPVTFNCYDTAGQEKFGGLRENYYVAAHAAIIMFDVTARMTYKSLHYWHKDIERVCGPIPIVICGNKVDCLDRKVKPKDITYHHKKKLQYYDISAKSNFNLEKPFLYLVRKLCGNSECVFVKSTAMIPPEVLVDSKLLREYEILSTISNAVLLHDDGKENEL